MKIDKTLQSVFKHFQTGDFDRAEVRSSRRLQPAQKTVAFTLCLRGNVGSGSILGEPEIMNNFADVLASVVTNAGCIVPVYCLMPNHQHIIIAGTQSDSDIYKAIISYKQRTGFWMSANQAGIRQQKDFYDRVIRKHENVVTQVKYILDNPVRKGLVSSWEENLYKGSIGCELKDVLQGIM